MIIFLGILFSILFMICFAAHRIDKKKSNCIILEKENLYTKRIYYFIIPTLLFVFLIGNYLTAGTFFRELFYKIENDFALDFHVFLSESVLNNYCYIENNQGFNPPLIKIISLFIYRSFSPEYQLMFEQSSIYNTQQDIRLIVQAMLPFIFFIIIGMVLLCLIVFSHKTGNLFERWYYVFLASVNIGIVFAIERGNYVIIAVPLSLFFVLNYNSNNKYIKEFSLISLAVAAGLKVYPCLLGVLLLKNKMWKESMRTIFYGCVTLFGPFVFYGGFAGIIGFLSGLKGTGETSSRLGTLNMTSFFYTMLNMAKVPKSEIILQMGYLKIFAILLLLLAIVCLFTFKEEWKVVLMTVLLMILYSGTAHTYMLAFLIIPIFLFFNKEHNSSSLNYIYLILFIFCSGFFVSFPGNYILELRTLGERLTRLMLLQQSSIFLLFTLLLISGYWDFICKISINFYKRDINEQ